MTNATGSKCHTVSPYIMPASSVKRGVSLPCLDDSPRGALTLKLARCPAAVSTYIVSENDVTIKKMPPKPQNCNNPETFHTIEQNGEEGESSGSEWEYVTETEEEEDEEDQEQKEDEDEEEGGCTHMWERWCKSRTQILIFSLETIPVKE